jgi:hypothetical protein
VTLPEGKACIYNIFKLHNCTIYAGGEMQCITMLKNGQAGYLNVFLAPLHTFMFSFVPPANAE